MKALNWPMFLGPLPCPVVNFHSYGCDQKPLPERIKDEVASLHKQHRAAMELRRYLRAISPDLPLARDATGWLVSTGEGRWAKVWPIKPFAICLAAKPVVRWQPFGGAA